MKYLPGITFNLLYNPQAYEYGIKWLVKNDWTGQRQNNFVSLFGLLLRNKHPHPFIYLRGPFNVSFIWIILYLMLLLIERK